MDTLLQIAIVAAREAGAKILELYTTTDFDIKTDGSPVTIADTSANEILHKHLKETDILILSEESTGVPIPYPSKMWIIDPLDGTKDFLNKTGDFSVMIALLENGRPTLGVVYAPALDTLYYATKGGGAYVLKNGVTTRLQVGNRDTGTLRFLRSVNHYTPNMAQVAEKLGAELCPRGSIGIKAGLLGEDAGDFFFSWGRFGEWDVCAPEIITEEAGGHVTDCLGHELVYGTLDHLVEHGILFSNGACHEQVLDAIRTTPRPVH